MDPTGLLLSEVTDSQSKPGEHVWVCGSLRLEMGQGQAEILWRRKWRLKVATEGADETGRVLTTEVVAWCSLWGGYKVGVHWRAGWRKPPERAFCQW